MPLAQLTVLVSALVGWSDITIQPSRGDRAAFSYQRSVAGIDRPSERTLETLRRYDLDNEYRRDVNACLLHLEKYAQKRAEAELVYALAELSWIEAKRLDHRRKPQAIDRFLDAAAYAYDYLFDDDPVLAEGRGPVRPAVPTGHGDLQRRGRPPDPRGADQGPDPAAERRGDSVQGSRPRTVAADRPQGLPLEPRGHPQDAPGLGLRGERHQPGPLSVRPGRPLDRGSRDRDQERRAPAAGAILSRPRWPFR